MSTMELAKAIPSRSLSQTDTAVNDDDNDNSDIQEQQRIYDLNTLRHFLLTSNAEQRAARRKQQEVAKQELIREYLQSLSDQDSNRFQEIKKRFCASLDEFYATQAACLG
ncbi:unnamed protein product [Rotaria sordida]|uniref:Uncharacterized protein n=1 Tax=Rotaria sordida TaxID=392033 RepID=A0A813XRD5_9BILA|nr:unnamed protein product [Rotaria sordida]CAF0875218.1 unnamed protein product [Rotaria sordida]CAF0907633.1 unnamed protein product [Rotaria sordida]CAF3539357.1 unnamed protein product [Rotaria sordida]